MVHHGGISGPWCQRHQRQEQLGQQAHLGALKRLRGGVAKSKTDNLKQLPGETQSALLQRLEARARNAVALRTKSSL
ncbi:hypothetical protein Plec18170_009784 [Paecilomyces lecythidis]